MPRRRLSDAELNERLRGLYSYDRVDMPKLAVEERDSFDEIALGYDAEEARAEALRCMQCQDPPCVKACPAHLNVPAYVKAIQQGDFQQGLQIIWDTYPLPGTCGRICFHPCTDVCLKGVRGEPINIPRLRRFLADTVSPYDLDIPIRQGTGKSLACIGSGPASLTCAYHLRRCGHRVVVFEQGEKIGGTLLILPDYRLPKDVLAAEVEFLKSRGIEFRTNSAVAGTGCVDRLLEEFDAVFIGVGAIGSQKPKLPGIELAGSTTGLAYLRQVQAGSAPQYQRVAIVGAGDVAMDCLRTALRTAQTVHWIYRRSPEEMPAHGEELIELGEEVTLKDLDAVEDAFVHPFKLNVLRRARVQLLQLTLDERKLLHKKLEKGLKMRLVEELGSSGDGRRLVVHLLTNPVKVLGSGGVAGLECMRMRLGEPDKSGRREPVPVEASSFTIDVEGVIFAVGQNVEVGWLGEASGVQTDKWGQITVDQRTQVTSRAGVYAGGDGVRGPASMIDAIADGKRAADSIHDFLLTAQTTGGPGEN